MKYDMHIHTQDSDGKLSKLEVMREANLNKIDVIAFTDHNTCKNLDIDVLNKEYQEKYCENSNVTIIPGVEIDVGNYGGLHIIAYGLENTNDMQEILDTLNATNEEIAGAVIDNLRNIQNVDITREEVRKLNSDGKITKRSTIDVLMQKEYASSPDEACLKYVGKGAPSYIPRRELMYEDVLDLIKMCGGTSVLAHPGKLKNKDGTALSNREFVELVSDMKKYGLDGIECLTPKHTQEQVEFFNVLADEFDLIATGGNDFHNPGRGDKLGYDIEPDRYAMGLINKLIEEKSFNLEEKVENVQDVHIEEDDNFLKINNSESEEYIEI